MIAGTDICLRALLSQCIHRVLFQGAEPLRLKWQHTTRPKTLALWPSEWLAQELPNRLKRIHRAEGIVYQWAIAPRLSQTLGIPATAIAHDLADYLTTSSLDGDETTLLEQNIWHYCQVTVRDPHWIQIEVGDRALALWLQSVGDRPNRWQAMSNVTSASVTHLYSHSLLLGHGKGVGAKPQPLSHVLTKVNIAKQPERAEDLFPLQATHARCCSLLRLAEREGLMTLIPTEAEGMPQVIHTPHPLPWLTEAGQLRLSHPTERQLLKTWIDLLDEPEASLRRIHTLSAQFYAFEAACRILGAAKAHDPAQACVRLGLVLRVRHYLESILTDTGVKPLTEL